MIFAYVSLLLNRTSLILACEARALPSSQTVMPMASSGMVRDCFLWIASNEPHVLQVNTSKLNFDKLSHGGSLTTVYPQS
jgi:hypothetical protein